MGMAQNNNMEKRKIEKELFDMVYNWGKVGIQTDELCGAFQSKVKELINVSNEPLCDMCNRDDCVCDRDTQQLIDDNNN